MIPNSISASSLTNAELCLAMFNAVNMSKGTGSGSEPAMLGTVLHHALEHFTEPEYVASRKWEWSRLKEGFLLGWNATFVGQRPEGDWWDDGIAILEKWYNRSDIATDILDTEIVSREQKSKFIVPYWIDGTKYEMVCNFIIDRLDRLGPGIYRVVDYKSQRSPLSPSDLHHKIQPKLYALAVQIMHPDAKEIWVQFDFLRYERVATVFTRDEQVETWGHIKSELQRIIDTPENDIPETLNENCRYCPRRYTCKTFQKNVHIGGVKSLSVEQLSDLHYRLASQQVAIKETLESIEMELFRHAQHEDLLEFHTDGHIVKITSASRRVIDRDRMALILGPTIMADYGRINVGDLPNLRKDPRLNAAQLSMLDTAVSYASGEPKVKVMKKT